jgi:hypothetical protein
MMNTTSSGIAAAIAGFIAGSAPASAVFRGRAERPARVGRVGSRTVAGIRRAAAQRRAGGGDGRRIRVRGATAAVRWTPGNPAQRWERGLYRNRRPSLALPSGDGRRGGAERAAPPSG